MCASLQASGEVWYRLTLPSFVQSVRVDTCGSQTNFATNVWFVNACPSAQLNNPDVVAVNFGDTTCTTSRSSSTSLVSPRLQLWAQVPPWSFVVVCAPCPCS